jgi:VCBS repeat-containing protein
MDIDTGVNDAPVAVDDAYSGPHDRDLNVGAPGVLGNDTDADLDALTAVLGTTTGNGTLSLAADGSFSYTPDPGFVGSDSFTYRADDGSVPSGLATVTIDVTDAAPVAVADAYTVDKNASISVGAGTGVLANDTDPDAGETLTASVVSGPTDGSVTLAPDGSFDYTPDPGFSGTDSFTYQVSDGALTDTATASIDVVNQAPSAADDLYTGPKNLPLIVNAASGVLANDVDPNGDPLSASVVTGPSSGVLLLSANGGFTYTPITGFEGTDQFTYQATDGTATTTATVTIAVANDAPVAVDDSASVIHDRTLVVAAPGVLGNDTDANGDSLVSSVVTGPSSGSLTLDPDGGYTYSPDPGFIGTDSFSYRVDDGAATSGLATVTLSVTNVGPTANSDGYTGSKSMPLVVPVGSGVLADDVDPDGDALAAAVSSAPSNGTLLLAADGSFSYTPTAGFIGTDTSTTP